MHFLHVFLIASLTALAAATGTMASSTTVGLRLAFEPATLDWNLGDVPIHVINNVMEGLYAVDAKGEVVPRQATALPARRRSVYTINLKPGLKWSDGRPVRAQDYVYSWKRLRDPKTASTYANLAVDLGDVKAVGDSQLVIRLAPQTPPLSPAIFTHWATFPVREDLVKKFGDEWAKEPERMAFNGAYKIASYQRQSKLELVPNTEHAPPGTLVKIDALIVPDDMTALRLYESGRLHFMADLGALDRKKLEKRDDYRSFPSPVLMYLGLDVSEPLLKDAATRRLLPFAIGTKALMELAGGKSIRTFETVPPSSSNAVVGHADGTLSNISPLKDKAFTFGFYEKGINRTLVELLQAQFARQLGLKVKLESSEVKTYWTKLAQKPYPIFLNSYSPPVWDQRFYFDLLRPGNPMNMGRWKNATYESAFLAGDTSKMRHILSEEQPVVPLYFRSYDYLLSAKLKGAMLNPMTSLFLEQARLEP